MAAEWTLGINNPMTAPIPQPWAIPFFGNVKDIDKEVPLHSFLLLNKKFGEIYKLDMLGRPIIVVNSYALVNEVSDDQRFVKTLNSPLLQVRNLAGDGLFTAVEGEMNWEIAHRLLMPAFGTLNTRNMMEDMRDICSQLLLKWERFGPENVIDPTDDFTRVALDTIAFCSMSYRLNSFYTEEAPVFATAMSDFLKECFARSNRPAIVQAVMPSATAKYQSDMTIMGDLGRKIVADRKTHPTDKKDLLDLMLNGKDTKTGLGLSDESIAQNLLTFLIAGHETSSGMMSFIVYFLLKHPDAMGRLRREIDDVLQGRPVQVQDFDSLPYLIAVMRETLRLAPTASSRSTSAREDTTIGNGKYAIPKGVVITIQTLAMQRDPKVWGDDASDFRPERMLNGKFEALPKNAWQPFGFGMRGCIGRPFAWQEVALVITSVIQKFDLAFVDPSYTLELKQMLTIKPNNLRIRASPRFKGLQLFASPSSSLLGGATNQTTSSETSLGIPLYVLYGSNTGTSEAFAQRIATDAHSHGFTSHIGTLDSASGNLPKDGPIVIVTASFEGEPADNAGSFVSWLTHLEGDTLKGVKYSIFGCGNADWAKTFQRIPILCDEHLVLRGATCICERGVGDAGHGDFFQVFDEYEGKLWECLSKEYSTKRAAEPASTLQVETVATGTERAAALRQDNAALGTVVENRVLTQAGAPVKRHIEFKLPEGMSYRAGDYLAIIPQNPVEAVQRVLAYFGLSTEHKVVLTSSGPTSLPTGKPVSIFEILRGYVEISQSATVREIKTLMTLATTSLPSLQSLIDAYPVEVQEKRLSVLDILETFKDIKIPLSTFLSFLPPMRVRQYSISSSPLWNPEHVTLTISILESPAHADNSRVFRGVASNYLGGLIPGEPLQMIVRPSNAAFHAPEDPTVPMVMCCAGSGLAPIRGFIQERAMQKQAGREVGKALLFFGCRSPSEDYLYGDSQLAEWARMGVVDIRMAFSRATEQSEGCKYVQDRVWKDRSDVRDAFFAGAKFYTCGTGRVGQGIKDVLKDIIQENAADDDIDDKFDRISKGRYITDVFD